MHVAVIIPTYNEAGAIGALLDDVVRTCADEPAHQWSVIIVDANSPDGTADIVQDRQAVHPQIHLIVEPEKQGIAMAYLAGISHAHDVLNADVFVEFDGDGQHDPADIVHLIAALDSGYDCAIGSRYIPGGSIPAEWLPHRKLLSRFGSLYARLLLEVPVHDVTSGLKATRMRALPPGYFAPEILLTRDYAYKIQFLFDAWMHGARITEIPIQFRLREFDTSKSTWRDIIESLRVTALLRWRYLHHWRMPRVLVIGSIGFLVQWLIIEQLSLQERLVAPSTAVLIGAELVILLNFVLNNRFSFHDRTEDSAPLIWRLVRFHVVASGSVAAQWLAMWGAEQMTTSVMLLRLAFIASIGLGFIINYAGYYFWVWRAK
jgi:dolichol-phosphate mannosyltransferase